MAVLEADADGQSDIEPEHSLLAPLGSQSSHSGTLLRQAGVTSEAVREELLRNGDQ
jgi:hypothetical protein